jgi:SAM-dependent methyltransferase
MMGKRNDTGMKNSHVDRDLQLLAEASQYQDWIYSLISPFLGNRILDIGSGIGTYIKKFLGRELVLATDLDPSYVSYLNSRFAEHPEVSSQVLDLCNISESQKRTLAEKRIDTIVLLNVLEHVNEALEALKNLSDCLCKSGRLIVVVPAMQILYSNLDKVYGHWRRYSRGDFKQMEASLNMTLLTCYYFNFFGFFGWFVNTKLFNKKHLPVRQTIYFDKLSPIFSKLEKYLPPPLGLSIIAVFERKD